MKNFNILAIIGPTACGKTALAVKLALRFGGEIISGDSRQVFRGMNIGTGKDLNEYKTPSGEVTCHMIDIADPNEDYNLYRYIDGFRAAFSEITFRGRIPILAGGSGLYMEGALKGYSLYPAPEDSTLRAELECKTKSELIPILEHESPDILASTDTSSARRIIRGIEIARYINANPSAQKPVSAAALKPLIIGITMPRNELIQRIDSRLEARLKQGMVDETRSLLERGVSYERMLKLGLEYRYTAMYINGEISYGEMVEKLKTEIHKFSKRQMTWFRGMERRGLAIHWISGGLDEAVRIVNEN